MPRVQSKKRKRELSGGAQNRKQFLSLEPRQDNQCNSSSSSRPITSGQGLPTSTASCESKQSSSSKNLRPNLSKFDMYEDNLGCNDIVNIGSLGNLLSQIVVSVNCRGSLSV